MLVPPRYRLRTALIAVVACAALLSGWRWYEQAVHRPQRLATALALRFVSEHRPGFPGGAAEIQVVPRGASADKQFLRYDVIVRDPARKEEIKVPTVVPRNPGEDVVRSGGAR